MKKNELLENISLMRSNVEWDYPMDFAATLDICEDLVQRYYKDSPNCDGCKYHQVITDPESGLEGHVCYYDSLATRYECAREIKNE